eukprot:TRINITY_DN8378_c0_g1_i3.p1 TRINITY_DN8378_c0_g1~~TRINITY_DN8378_c0_g1_i3.p1  ORF type:complete len:421 (+),score=93.91 TRINITY_DN8378_c0_g1_i3:127-1389(+)
MGCGNSKQKQKGSASFEAYGKKRLSVTTINSAEAKAPHGMSKEGRTQPTAKDSRMLLSEVVDERVSLLTKDHLKRLNADDNSSYALVGSRSDLKESPLEPFASKGLRTQGSSLTEIQPGVGHACHKGLKSQSTPSQDAFSILSTKDCFSVYGVYDGHGAFGELSSELARANLPRIILQDERFLDGSAMPEVFRNSFQEVNHLVDRLDAGNLLNADLSGTTATVVVHDQKLRKLHIAHVSDCSAVMGRWDEQTNKVVAVRLTLEEEHKPDHPEENARIKSSGGQVQHDGLNYRVCDKDGIKPGLAMSRAIGDLYAQKACGVICEPVVTNLELTEDDRFFMLCSDGVWEFITPEEAVETVSRYGPNEAKDAAEALAKEAWDRWMKEEGGEVVDDITAVVVFLTEKGIKDTGDDITIGLSLPY